MFGLVIFIFFKLQPQSNHIGGSAKLLCHYNILKKRKRCKHFGVKVDSLKYVRGTTVKRLRTTKLLYNPHFQVALVCAGARGPISALVWTVQYLLVRFRLRGRGREMGEGRGGKRKRGTRERGVVGGCNGGWVIIRLWSWPAQQRQSGVLARWSALIPAT